MAKSNKVKKKPGRPATGKDPLVSARVPTETVAAITQWALKNGGTRSEAIRRLVELGLTIKVNQKQSAAAARAHRAKELATKAIDKMIDPSAPPEERDQRRRRLTKGPLEFRDDRVDLPKGKGK